mgnify:FL=1
MAVPGVDPLFLRERLRYLGALQKEDQRLWDPDEMLLKAYDVTYGLKAEKGKTFDVPQHIIAAAHISTAMQGSIYPGEVDTSLHRGSTVLSKGSQVKQQRFNSHPMQVPPGLGDKNTDEMLQQALRQFLVKGELQTKSALEFSMDRPGRGR